MPGRQKEEKEMKELSERDFQMEEPCNGEEPGPMEKSDLDNAKPKETPVEVLDEKGRCLNTRFECTIIYQRATGLSGLRDQSGKTIIEKRLIGQPAYAFGKIKDKLRPIVEDMDEMRVFPPESAPAKYGQKLRELRTEYGKFDEAGNFTFYDGTTEEERAEFRERVAELKAGFPGVEKEIDQQNIKIRERVCGVVIRNRSANQRLFISLNGTNRISARILPGEDFVLNYIYGIGVTSVAVRSPSTNCAKSVYVYGQRE